MTVRDMRSQIALLLVTLAGKYSLGRRHSPTLFRS